MWVILLHMALNQRLRLFVNTKKQFLKFLFVGALNTIFGILIFGFLTLTSMPTWAILLISNVMGVVFNFFTTGRIVFSEKGYSTIYRFLILNFFIYWMYLFSISILLPFVGNRLLAMLIIIWPITVVNYLLMRDCVFLKSSKV